MTPTVATVPETGRSQERRPCGAFPSRRRGLPTRRRGHEVLSVLGRAVAPVDDGAWPGGGQGWSLLAADAGAAVDHHGVSVGPPRRPSPDRTNSTISSLTTQPLYRDDAWVTTNDSRCCSDSKRVGGLGGVERAPFEPLRTARLFPDAIAWTSRFHRRVVRQDAAHAATEIVAHPRIR